MGPAGGGLFTIALNEGLRILFGAHFIGAANAIYGILLILFIIFTPRDIVRLAAGVFGRPSSEARASAVGL